MIVDVRLTVDGGGEVPLSLDSGGEVDLSLGVPYIGGDMPPYDGPYRVTPIAWDEQTLYTRNKTMSDNVTVEEIPYSRTGNEAGGYTVSIAS